MLESLVAFLPESLDERFPLARVPLRAEASDSVGDAELTEGGAKRRRG